MRIGIYFTGAGLADLATIKEMLAVSEQFCDNIHALVYTQHAAVQRQVVVLRMTPLHVGVETVVGGAALVLVTQALLRGMLTFSVHLDDTLGTEFHIRMDKDLQTVRLVLQNVVGTAPDDDAGALFGKV